MSEFLDKIKEFKASLDPQNEKYSLLEPEEFFRDCIKLSELKEDIPIWCRVGVWPNIMSPEKINTPVCLYRLLYLTKPEQVTFADMYKGNLFYFGSICGRYLVAVNLSKYRLSLEFYTTENLEMLWKEPSDGPEWDSNVMMNPASDGYAFFQMVVEAITREWSIYPGNFFRV